MNKKNTLLFLLIFHGYSAEVLSMEKQVAPRSRIFNKLLTEKQSDFIEQNYKKIIYIVPSSVGVLFPKRISHFLLRQIPSHKIVDNLKNLGYWVLPPTIFISSLYVLYRYGFGIAHNSDLEASDNRINAQLSLQLTTLEEGRKQFETQQNGRMDSCESALRKADQNLDADAQKKAGIHAADHQRLVGHENFEKQNAKRLAAEQQQVKTIQLEAQVVVDALQNAKSQQAQAAAVLTQGETDLQKAITEATEYCSSLFVDATLDDTEKIQKLTELQTKLSAVIANTNTSADAQINIGQELLVSITNNIARLSNSNMTMVQLINQLKNDITFSQQAISALGVTPIPSPPHSAVTSPSNSFFRSTASASTTDLQSLSNAGATSSAGQAVSSDSSTVVPFKIGGAGLLGSAAIQCTGSRRQANISEIYKFFKIKTDCNLKMLTYKQQ